MQQKMKKSLSALGLLVVLTACSSPTPQISSEEAQARLAHLENWEEREYQKATKRNEEGYQTYRQRRIEALEDQKIALQNEKIHYQNQAIQYQNQRRATKDAIDDLGEIQMNRAKAINKANENISKKKPQNIYILR